MKITRMNHVAYNVAGVGAAAREFYTKLLGLPEVPISFPGRAPMMGSDRGFWIEQDGVQMHLIGVEKTGEPREPVNTHVSWYVEDLAAAIAEIRAAGLEMREMTGDVGHIVWISDPAGNTIELQQDPQTRAP
jgi:catechol 2,3-dioxygenase-like lactoylglutathione lyase family enzyme